MSREAHLLQWVADVLPGHALTLAGGSIAEVERDVSFTGDVTLCESSGNWAAPGWNAAPGKKIRIGVATVSDDDAQPWITCTGFITRSHDVGVRIETPNGTTLVTLAAFGPTGAIAYLAVDFVVCKHVALPCSTDTPSDLQLAAKYGTWYLDGDDVKMRIRRADGVYGRATLGTVTWDS